MCGAQNKVMSGEASSALSSASEGGQERVVGIEHVSEEVEGAEEENEEGNIADEAAPPDISFADTVFDVKFHSSKDLLVAGDVNGKVHLYLGARKLCA